MNRESRSEFDANAALVRTIARKNQHLECAKDAHTVEAFRDHIRAATNAWTEERKLRAARNARKLA